MKNLLSSFVLLLFCSVITKSFGQSTTLAGGNTSAGNISPAIMYATPVVSNPVASFSLVQTGSNADLTQVQVTTTGTYSASTDITAFTLYVNTVANSINGSTAVTSATVTAAGPGLQTITLSTPYTLSTGVITSYFFIVPTFGSSAVPGNTIAVAAISSGNIAVSAGSVTGSAAATGTLTIINPTITGTTPASLCGTGTLTLGATASAGAAINWFDVSSGGTSLGTGTSFTTPTISSPTTYYAEASKTATIQTGTLSDNTTALALYYMDQRTDLHWFSSTNACTINSVDIYPAYAGPIVITMTDASGVILATAPTITIDPSQISTTVPVTVPLGFSVPAGATNYRLGGDGTFTLTQAIYRGASNSAYGPYPTTVAGFAQVGDAGGNSTATGTSGAFDGYGARCYFYNWNVTLTATSTPRSSDLANANPYPTGVSATATPAAVCNGANLTLAGTASGATNYSWTGPGGTAVSSPSSLSTGVTGVVPGNVGIYTLTASVGSCSVTATTVAVSVNPVPVPTFITIPAAGICSGTSVTYATQPGQSSYAWSVPGFAGTDYNITSGGIGSGDSTVTLTWITPGAQTVTINYTNTGGCTGASAASNTTTVNPLPVPTFTASPGASICSGTSVTYTTEPGQSSYNWSVPGFAGTDYTVTSGGTGNTNNTVTLTWISPGSKTVTVNYTNASGCTGTEAASATTTVNSLPVPTFTASPAANTCANTSSVTYTTQASQLSYAWSVPGAAGTNYTINSGGTGSTSNTVTLTWITPGAQTVTVNYSDINGCSGTIAASSTTTVNPSAVPTFTSFPGTNTCAGSSVIYTTQGGQFSYSWNVPGTAGSDYTITSGGTGTTSNSVTLTWLSPGSKTVTVNYANSNGCTGVSAAANTTTVNSLPIPAFTTSPAANICANSSVTYTTASDQSSYSWSVPGSAGTDYTITSGGTGSTDNSVTLTWASSGSKTVTVNYFDANGCTGAMSASTTTNVNPLPVPAFTAAPVAEVCANSSVTYTIDPGQLSYDWSVPGTPGIDYIITSGGTGSGDNTVTLTWITPGSMTVSVNYTNTNGCTGLSPATNTILIDPLPEAIAGPGQVCLTSAITLTDATTGGAWSSSNPSVADVDPASGVVTGEAADVATLTYTLPTGCTTSASVIVNPLPDAISGSNTVCAGLTTPLSDAGGGTWSSSDESLATVGLHNGIITGVFSGSPVITYTLPTGCVATTSFTVNPLPSAISGITAVCEGSTTTLGDADADGTWTSSGAFYATVDLTSGQVTGVHAGAPAITYTLPTGCIITTGIVVNPLPAAITGIGAVCIGSTVTLNDAATGGSWSTVDGSLASVSGPNVTGIASGTPVITYTLPTSCSITKSIVVNPLPSAITGTTTVCMGGAAALTDPDGGGTWSSSNTFRATVDISSGVVNGFSAGTVNITYQFPTGCNIATPVTVNPVASITGIAQVCAGAATTLSNSVADGTWSSSNSSVATVDIATGSASGLIPGLSVITYTTPGGCSSTAQLTVNALPIAYTVTGGGNICTGSTGVTIGLSGSNAGVSYQLFNGGTATGTPLTGTGGALTFGLHAAGGTYTVAATNLSGCSATMTGAASIFISSPPSVYTVTGGGNYCSGTGGLHVGLSGSDIGISYQLFHGITNVGSPLTGTGLPLDFGAITADEVYTVIASNDLIGACSSNMAGSAAIVTNALPAIYSVTGGGHYCSSGAGVHIGLDGSNSGINYQLYYDGSSIGLPATSAAGPVDFGLVTGAGTYTVIASNPATTCTVNMTSAATVTIDPSVVPSVSIGTGIGDVVCAGSLLNITAAILNGGLAPAYSWSRNGIPVPVTGGTYSYLPSDGDHVSVTLTSSAPCASPATVSSDLTLSVLAVGAPHAIISVSPNDTVCQGSLVNFTSSSSYGGSAPSFTWVVNSSIMGSGPSFSYTPANHDAVSLILGSNYQCRTADSGTSNTITMQVMSNAAPTVSIHATPGATIAIGETVTLSAIVTNGGTAPSYQWYVNGSAVPGSNGPTFTSSSLTNDDTVSCTVTTNGLCSGLVGQGLVAIHVTEGVSQIVTTGNDLHLVPNPNKGAFAIKGTLGSATDAEVSLVVTNMLGQVVYKTTAIAQNGVLNEQVLLNSSLANGMYLLNVRSGNENAVFHFVMEK